MQNIFVTKAKYISEYKIHLHFSDRKSGILDFENMPWGEMFEPLKDIEKFKNFTLNRWTIEWENEADFAPEFLRRRVLEQREMV